MYLREHMQSFFSAIELRYAQKVPWFGARLFERVVNEDGITPVPGTTRGSFRMRRLQSRVGPETFKALVALDALTVVLGAEAELVAAPDGNKASEVGRVTATKKLGAHGGHVLGPGGRPNSHPESVDGVLHEISSKRTFDEHVRSTTIWTEEEGPVEVHYHEDGPRLR